MHIKIEQYPFKEGSYTLYCQEKERHITQGGIHPRAFAPEQVKSLIGERNTELLEKGKKKVFRVTKEKIFNVTQDMDYYEPHKAHLYYKQ